MKLRTKEKAAAKEIMAVTFLSQFKPISQIHR